MKDIGLFALLIVAVFGAIGAIWITLSGDMWYLSVGIVALCALAYPKSREIWNRIILKKE